MRDSDGDVVPFRYTDGQSEYVTPHGPRRVSLPAGGSAYLGIAHPACVLGPQTTATNFDVILPGQRKPIGVSIPTTSGVSPTYQYCKGGPSDPGNTIALSPIEPTERQTQQ
jgi:hypothetical protein